jgi:hypothetical protein
VTDAIGQVHNSTRREPDDLIVTVTTTPTFTATRSTSTV